LASVLNQLDARLWPGHSIFGSAVLEPSNTKAVELVFTKLNHKVEKLPTATTTNLTKREIYYIYVDKDCTAKAKDISPILNYPYDTGGTEVNVRVTNITLELKQGWNRVTSFLYATASGGDLVIGKTDKSDLDNCKWTYPKP
jgi:hypothetical protein